MRPEISMTCNFHTHTWRCQHAGSTEREYVEAAIAAGIGVLGFSDHVPCPYENGYVSHTRMRPEQAAEYVETIRALGREYAKDITLYVGFETEYYPDFHARQTEWMRALGVDYQILGQHSIDPYENPYMAVPFTEEKWLTRYVDLVLEGIATGQFSYVAHPDLPAFLGDGKFYRREMRRLIEGLIAQGLPAEINMLGMATNRNYPNPAFWELAGEMGCPAVIGIDAHRPEAIGRADVWRRCMDLAERSHVRVLTTGRLAGNRIIFPECGHN